MITITLITLSFFYSLLFVLAGRALLGPERQRRLGHGAVALGFLVLYPIFTILVVWVPPVWAFGLAAAGIAAAWLQPTLRQHAADLLPRAVGDALLVTALAVVFLIPGFAGAPAGLFSEAGGDFTIYAGLPAKVGDHPLWGISGHEVGPFRHTSFSIKTGGGAQLSSKASPPSAGWSMDSIVELGWASRNPGWYSLQQVLFQVSWGPLDWQYLAMLAVLWAVVIIAVQRLVHLRYGRRAGLLALATLGGSHALLAVAYNHYLPQLLATGLTVSAAFALGLPEGLALPRAARFALAAVAAAFIGVAYYPMLPAIVIPFALLLGSWRTTSSPLKLGRLQTKLIAVGTAFTALTTAFLYYAQAHGIRTMLTSFLLTSTRQDVTRQLNALGAPRAHDLGFFDALFGGVPLQLLPPYSLDDPTKTPAAIPLVVGGAMLVAAFLALLVREWLPNLRLTGRDVTSLGRGLSEEARFRSTLGVGAIALLTANLILGRRYEYTQFKGLAYVLPFTLLACILGAEGLFRKRRAAVRAYATTAIILFIGSLVYFQVDGMSRVTERQDRAAALDESLVSVAGEVRRQDERAFVLAFPSQPSQYSLWELGMRDTRGLIMRYYNYAQPKQMYVAQPDLSHLWVLESVSDESAIPVGATRSGSIAAWPATRATCSTRAAVLTANGTSHVPFGAGAADLWRETDADYWIFDARSARGLEVLLKEHPAVHGHSATFEILYPNERTLHVPVRTLSDTDAIASLPAGELPSSPLIVLRVPGTGYSNVYCK